MARRWKWNEQDMPRPKARRRIPWADMIILSSASVLMSFAFEWLYHQ